MAASVGYFIEYIMMHGTINIKLLAVMTQLVAGKSGSRGSISARGKDFFIFHTLSERSCVYAVFYAMGASVQYSNMQWPRC